MLYKLPLLLVMTGRLCCLSCHVLVCNDGWSVCVVYRVTLWSVVTGGRSVLFIVSRFGV